MADLRAWFSFAPIVSPYPEPIPGQVFDPSQPLPVCNHPLPNPAPGVPPKPYQPPVYQFERWFAGIEAFKPGRVEFFNLGRAAEAAGRSVSRSRWRQHSQRYLANFIRGMFAYGPNVNAAERQRFDSYVLSHNEPGMGNLLIRFYDWYEPFVPTITVGSPGDSISLESIFEFAFHSIRLPRTVQIMTEWFRFTTSPKLFNALVSRTNFGNVLKAKQGYLPQIEFRRWLRQSQKFKTPEVKEALFDPQNQDFLRQLAELIRMHWDETEADDEIWKQAIASAGVDISKVDTVRMEQMLSSVWTNFVWTGTETTESGRRPRGFHYITEPNLIAVYSVAPFLPFKPELQLYLHPDQESAVNSFSEKYGYALAFLQELWEAFDGWYQEEERIVEISSQRLRNVRSDASIASSQICEKLATRFVDQSQFDDIRGALWKLGNQAVVQGVPLRFLFDNQLPQAPSESSYKDLMQYADDLVAFSRSGLRSAVWHFDALRIWWDLLCRDVLNERLSQIIESSMPAEVVAAGYPAQVALASALRSFAAGSPIAKVRADVARSRLPVELKQSVERRFNAVTRNRAVPVVSGLSAKRLPMDRFQKFLQTMNWRRFSPNFVKITNNFTVCCSIGGQL